MPYKIDADVLFEEQSMFGTNNFGTNLWTSARNINFGTEFNWNLKFDIMLKDYVCRS